MVNKFIIVILLTSLPFSLYRGQSFRREFSNLEEIRNIIALSVHVMALTATATLTARKFITSSLCMRSDNTHIVYVPPVKHNIAYYVAEKPSGGIPVKLLDLL